MPVNRASLRRRLRAQDGFTLMIALGILMVVMLLTSGLVLAVQSDAGLTHDDLDGKRAYAAAQAGVQAYLYDLNHNAQQARWWQLCANDRGSATVPGNDTESYSFAPVVACDPNNPDNTVLDESTGQLRIEFTGTSGTAHRTIVAAFRTLSPLSYLWYTKYETKDTTVDPNANCDQFYWQTPQPDPSCQINWITGDQVNGPMYSQDNYLIDGTPRFGDSDNDSIASSAPTDSVCVGAPANGPTYQESCPRGVIQGTEDPRATYIPLPTDNSNLESDAEDPSDGVVLKGATTLTITPPSSATAYTCTSNSSDSTSCSTTSIDLTKTPLIYDETVAGCTASYNPTNVPAPDTVSSGVYKGKAYGPCGDVYLQTSTYGTSVTIAAQDDIIVQGDVLNGSRDANGIPTGSATMGLVADNFVRVAHPRSGGCPNPDRTIDAAILTLAHSFFVDNYDCGSGGYGTLTVDGAIAQMFRGVVGQAGGEDGYIKDYSYDHRLSYLLPPYVFDLQDSAWQIVRETLCGSGLPDTNPQSCAYTGTTS